MPSKKSEADDKATPHPPYLLIGETVPNNLEVTNPGGKPQPLVSFKTGVEVLVVEFLSARCPYSQGAWKDLAQLYNHYNEWHVSFVAVSANSDETAQELSDAMAKAGLSYSVVRDDKGAVTRKLRATATPEILVIDEGNVLRYRGALNDAMLLHGKGAHIPYVKQALEAVIGHIDSVPHPEPGAFIGCSIH